MIDFSFNSPVEELSFPLFKEKGLRLFIKRDDLIHPFISGNKWRKLKYILRKALQEKKNHLVTFGGAWSNHLLASACAAAKFGFKITGIVRGEEVNNSTLFLCRMFGMQLRFVSRENYRDKKSLFDFFYKTDTHSFFIDEGGASEEAALGCAELINELEENYSHIFCACGTGTTAAGIINGIASQQYSSRFHGIPVLKNGGFIRTEIQNYLKADSIFELHTGYDFGGYAKTSAELLEFIKNFSSRTGILIDPVYTGKMLFAIFDLAAKDYFKKGDKILAIHTGGLFGVLGMEDKFKNIQL